MKTVAKVVGMWAGLFFGTLTVLFEIINLDVLAQGNPAAGGGIAMLAMAGVVVLGIHLTRRIVKP